MEKRSDGRGFSGVLGRPQTAGRILIVLWPWARCVWETGRRARNHGQKSAVSHQLRVLRTIAGWVSYQRKRGRSV